MFTFATFVQGRYRFVKISVVDPDRDQVTSASKCPGHADPDSANPDQYPFQANEKVDKVNTFQKISICCPKY
jgi:hypothetical protein